MDESKTLDEAPQDAIPVQVEQPHVNGATPALETIRAALIDDAVNFTFRTERPLSKKDIIRKLRPQIQKLRSRGASWEDVADRLKAHDFTVSADYIRSTIEPKKKTKASKNGVSENSKGSKKAVTHTQSPRTWNLGKP